MKLFFTYTFIFLMLLGFSVPSKAQFSYIGAYDWAGVPKYLVVPGDTISAVFDSSLVASLPEYRSVPLYEPQLLAPGRPETISINCQSDVWITYIRKGGWFQSVVGYYTFPTDKPLTVAPPDASIKIILPNASTSGFGGGLNPGDKVYLGNFPPNTSIGFVLIANGWDGSTGTVTQGMWKFYADSRFNPEADSTLRRHMVMLWDTATNRLVTGFEDTKRDAGSDQDFNDVLIYTTIKPFCVLNTDSIPVMNLDGHFSLSGNKGGLESRNIGDGLAKRVYNNALASKPAEVDYSELPRVTNRRISTFGPGGGSYSLADIMPTSLIDSGIIAYSSTPADVPSISNAVAVNSIDFTYANQCRAVAFATETLGSVYSHTKPVCDRLKGAQLIDISNFTINSLNFTKYTLKQPQGNIEYAMSFSVGIKAGRNSFSYQSNWLNDDYVAEDTMYNYQIWGATPYYCVDMAVSILNKLNAIMPVKQLKPSAALPATYFVAGSRNGTDLVLNVTNKTAGVSGYVTVQDLPNESSLSDSPIRTIPFTVAANGNASIKISELDNYESAISLYVNGKKEDALFMTDGAWSVDSTVGGTVINNFEVNNDTSYTENVTDEFRVLRNVTLNASSNTYVSVYKLMKGGGDPVDFTGYNSLKITASGAANTRLHIYLVKNSITAWANQYSYTLPLTVTPKDYIIDLADFVSAGSADKINPNDLSTVVFSYEITDNHTTTFNGTLSKISFSKLSAAYYTNTAAGSLIVYPNPTNGSFTAGFNATTTSAVSIRIIEAATGRSVLTESITPVIGNNNIPLQINEPGSNAYFILMEGSDKKFAPAKVIVIR